MKAELIDHLGNDLRVVNAARVSFNKESDWEVDYNWTTQEFSYDLSERDQKLIKYLANHGHWTPFSQVIIQMRETVPIFVARQRFKHCIGFTYPEEGDGLEAVYNETSRRYVDDPPEFYRPDEWRGPPENAKQGSNNEVVQEILLNVNGLEIGYDDIIKLASDWYETNKHIAPEQARMVLPQSMYTSYYVTGSLAAWARAYKQRIDPHAQKEIQDLAKQWNEIISNIEELKYSWNALKGE